MSEGRLKVVGKARARRYQLSTTETAIPAILSPHIQPLKVPHFDKSLEQLIPLSSIALSIQTNVRQPIQARQPVGYNREFLNKYRSNEIYYLSESIRKHLFVIGKPPDAFCLDGAVTDTIAFERHVRNCSAH